MRFCRSCAGEIEPTDTSCNKCGAAIERKEYPRRFTPRRKIGLVLLIIFLITIIIIVVASVAFFQDPSSPGVEVKIYFNGEWEGGMWVDTPEVISGTGDTTYEFPIPDTGLEKTWVSVWVSKEDADVGELKLEIWVNGVLEFEESTTEPYGIITGFADLPTP